MKVYFDNAATTRVRKEVIEQMLPYLTDNFGNPSSIHYYGRKAKVAVEEAREQISELINCDPSEIYFTSGGTEANNLAVRGIAEAEFSESSKNGLICSLGEHHCVIDTMRQLSEKGFCLNSVKIHKDSTLVLSDFQESINRSTSLAAVMHTNNETGAINRIEEISSLNTENKFYLHCDAVQGFGKTNIDVRKLGVDSLAMSAHKIGGPKGTGAAFIKIGTPLNPILTGGSQERNRRGGTENVAGIIGFATAAKLAHQNLNTNYDYITDLRNRLIQGLAAIDSANISINNAKTQSPYILSVTLNPECYKNDAEAILMFLDINGVAASNGAACSSGTLKPSHVNLNSGKSAEESAGTLRFSFSIDNTAGEVDYILEVMQKLTQKFAR